MDPANQFAPERGRYGGALGNGNAFRTQEQIIAQCEARLRELKREAASPAMTHPCATCRWGDPFYAAWCHHPLVKGFGGRVHMGSGSESSKSHPRLCGPEKALWEPKPTLFQRITNWFLKPWRE